MATRVIFLFGRPGVGKLTVGEQLAIETGYRLLHNHAVVDLRTSDRVITTKRTTRFTASIHNFSSIPRPAVNVGFFGACDTAPICGGRKTNTCTPGKVKELDGTGYELDDGDGLRQGGATGWLTTTTPVTPGETATLRFILFDEGDEILDSAVVIDNFQWQLMAAAGPETIQ